MFLLLVSKKRIIDPTNYKKYKKNDYEKFNTDLINRDYENPNNAIKNHQNEINKIPAHKLVPSNISKNLRKEDYYISNVSDTQRLAKEIIQNAKKKAEMSTKEFLSKISNSNLSLREESNIKQLEH